MIDQQQCWQEELFVAGPLSSLVPDDHVLRELEVSAWPIGACPIGSTFFDDLCLIIIVA